MLRVFVKIRGSPQVPRGRIPFDPDIIIREKRLKVRWQKSI